MDSTRDLFDYWHGKVRLKNIELIRAPQHVETYRLRHDCTNYDELRQSPEVSALSEDDRTQTITIIKYQCTAQVLQHRTGCLREAIEQQELIFEELEEDKSRLMQYIRRLKQALLGKNEEVAQLKTAIETLRARNAVLEAAAENSNAYAQLIEEMAVLRNQYEAEKQHRQKLARKNQSLGGQVAHTKRYKQQLEETKSQLKENTSEIKMLKKENQRLEKENEKLRSQLQKHQKSLN